MNMSAKYLLVPLWVMYDISLVIKVHFSLNNFCLHNILRHKQATCMYHIHTVLRHCTGCSYVEGLTQEYVAIVPAVFSSVSRSVKASSSMGGHLTATTEMTFSVILRP